MLRLFKEMLQYNQFSIDSNTDYQWKKVPQDSETTAMLI